MLGRTAGGVFWMFRYLERSENTARLVETGLRISLTRAADSVDEWTSVVTTAGARDAYLERHGEFEGRSAVDFLVRDPSNPSSVVSGLEQARNNARQVRTALTREVWEATNTCWMRVSEVLAQPIADRELPEVLEVVRRECALVRGALHGTMLRNDIYNFSRLGTLVERADNTARILDVKYYLLLPSPLLIGSRLDSGHWETILRALSAQRSFHWQHPGVADARGIAKFLILDRRMPRSLSFSYGEIASNLALLAEDYGARSDSLDLAEALRDRLTQRTIHEIFDEGLHEFLADRIADTDRLARQIELDYRFTR